MTDVLLLLDVLWWWLKVPYPEWRMIVYSNVKDGKIAFCKLPVNEERQNLGYMQ